MKNPAVLQRDGFRPDPAFASLCRPAAQAAPQTSDFLANALTNMENIPHLYGWQFKQQMPEKNTPFKRSRYAG